MQELFFCLVLVIFVFTILAFVPVFADMQVTIVQGAGDSVDTACTEGNNCFLPNSGQVASGDTVTWKNTDKYSHTVTSGTPDNSTGNVIGAVFDSGSIAPGKTFSYTFTADDVGTVKYFCQVHPWMVGEVTVSSSQTAQQTVPEFGPMTGIVSILAIISVVIISRTSFHFSKTIPL